MVKRYILIAAVLAVLALVALYQFSVTETGPMAVPRRLQIGDSWTYRVAFPDSKSYVLTESVLRIDDLNRTSAYVVFLDDSQHISTQYLWITPDWHEIKTFRPSIGNMRANSTVIYSPPIKLYHTPFLVGDHWTVKSTAHTIAFVNGTRIDTQFLRLEERTTSSVDTVQTPIGQFRAFKVTATSNGTLSEAVWFQTEIGQAVYGEFYNNNERVTQSLISYKLSPIKTSTLPNSFETRPLETQVFQKNQT